MCGLPTLLSNEAYTTLLRHDPQNWRIRKHVAAINAIELFCRQFDPSAKLKPSQSSVPPRLVILCDHYNHNFLIKHTDLKLSSIIIWRLIYRHMTVNKSYITTTSHKAIYISSNVIQHLMKFQNLNSFDENQNVNSRLDRTNIPSKTIPPYCIL